MRKLNYPSLKGRNVLVTGATSGIGKQLVIDLLDNEAVVIGVGRDRSKISELETNAGFHFISFDLSNIDEMEEMVKKTIKSFGKLDGLALCAGTEETIPLKMSSYSKMSSMFKVNLFSGLEFLRLFSKKTISNDNSSIVFISSVYGELGEAGLLGYCTTKSAVLGAVRSSALELAKRNIRVNSISPGLVKTPMADKMKTMLGDENFQKIIDKHPLGVREPKDVSPLLLFLLSDQSGWITGQNIKIDGGFSIQ